MSADWLREKKMGRSEAAKKKELRENRQELVQKLLAGKVFCDMSWDGALSFMLWALSFNNILKKIKTLLSDKNGDVDFGQDYGISRKEAIEKWKLSVQVWPCLLMFTLFHQDLKKIEHAAWISYKRGQQGVYYPEAMIMFQLLLY